MSNERHIALDVEMMESAEQFIGAIRGMVPRSMAREMLMGRIGSELPAQIKEEVRRVRAVQFETLWPEGPLSKHEKALEKAMDRMRKTLEAVVHDCKANDMDRPATWALLAGARGHADCAGCLRCDVEAVLLNDLWPEASND